MAEEEYAAKERAEDEASSLEVRGFRFLTAADAEKARLDAGKIAYLESHVSYSGAGVLEAVYRKAIENKIFQTPIGWAFLYELRGRLLKLDDAERDLPPIPMTVGFSHAPLPDDYVPKERIRRPPERGGIPRLPLSIACNVLLLVLVVAMFLIARTSDTDNILNYKRNVTNRYAEWETQLTEREDAIRRREKELGISHGEDTSAETAITD